MVASVLGQVYASSPQVSNIAKRNGRKRPVIFAENAGVTPN